MTWRPFALLSSAVLITAVAVAQAPRPVYSCPMHPEVRSAEPGRCPRCGMTLRRVPEQAPVGTMAMSGPAMSEPMTPMEEPLGLPMARVGSGTAWQPDSTPVYGHHFMAGPWMLMLHYNLLAGDDVQGTPRGGGQLMSVNWIMLMAQRAALGGQLTGRVMLSAEPLTTGGPSGYPVLLQTGEVVNGVPLHDRQHPHDLFMELAAKYDRPLSHGWVAQLYLAPAGEPALGPVAFPHRFSASADPFAALGHHWQDSTHISFGVATFGIYSRHWKLEASSFNGHEPDQNRYDFDFHPLDSYAGRLSYNPDASWSFQVSYGRLASPEQQAPGVSVQRLTASATYNRAFTSGDWATTAVFGRNVNSTASATNAALLETDFQLGPHTLFGRVEWVQRTGEDLVLTPNVAAEVFNAGTLQLGYVHDLALGPVTAGLGAVGMVDLLDSGLRPFYGSQMPLGGMLFVRLRPRDLVPNPSCSGPQP